MLSAVVGDGLLSCGGLPLWGLSVSRVLLGLSGAVGAVLFWVVSAFEVYLTFLLLSGMCGAAASLLLFCGLGCVRGLDAPRGWFFVGLGLAARGGGGIVTLKYMILIPFSFHAVVLIMVGIN